MPHSCIGALSHYHHIFVDTIISDNAKSVIEATAAGAAIYQAIPKPLKTALLSTFVIIVASVSVTKLPVSDAALFAQRIRPCLHQIVPEFPSPEPVKDSPSREAEGAIGSNQTAEAPSREPPW